MERAQGEENQSFSTIQQCFDMYCLSVCHTLVEENQCPSTIAIMPPFQKHQQSGSQRGELHKRRSRGQQPCSDCPTVGFDIQCQPLGRAKGSTGEEAEAVIKNLLLLWRLSTGECTKSWLVSSASQLGGDGGKLAQLNKLHGAKNVLNYCSMYQVECEE